MSMHLRIRSLICWAMLPVAALIAENISVSAAPVLPVIPARVFLVTSYGAVGNSTTLNTTALQNAINACISAGGGTVEVPSGTFLTGPLTLGSSVDLQVDSGGTILFSDNTSNYTLSGGNYQNCLYAKNCHDIAITGAGTIDGQGANWWARFNAGTDTNHRPYMIQITGCTRLLVQGVTLQNSPMFHLVPDTCQQVTIENIHISAPSTAPNTDGIDPDGWNYLIQNCTIDTGDDDIALKPSHQIDSTKPSCLNFLIQNCTFLHGHGMSIGGQTPGGLNGMVVQNCTFNGTVAGIRMKAGRGTGGTVQNVVYNNLTMTNVATPIQITSYYPSSPTDAQLSADTAPTGPVPPTTPIWKNISINNVTATGASTDMQIFGLPEMPVTNITLSNVSLSGKNGVTIARTDPSNVGVQFTAVSYSVTSGAPLTLIDATISTVSPTTISGMAGLQNWLGVSQPLVFTLTPTGTTAGIPFSQTLTPAADASFILPNVPAGTYTLGIKGALWLQKDVTINTSTANVSNVSVSLLAGDINGDNAVSASDLALLRAAYGTTPASATWNPNADLNGDHLVTLTDVAMLRANYGKQGDP